MRGLLVVMGVLAVGADVARAQVVQPGQSAADQAKPEDPDPNTPGYQTTVVGKAAEDELVGGYQQPRWTTRRRFPTTRVYVVPAGEVELEWWLEGKIDLRGDDDTRWRSMYELELGLGHRLQLDLYLVTQQLGEGPFELYQEKVELRYALADWGRIPTNPTLYVEWVRQHDAPTKAELKALFGGQLAPGWHWGANLVYERELGGAREQEYALTGGIAHPISRRLSVGAEVKLETVDVAGDRLAFDVYEILAGPSLQWLPAPNIHVDLVVPVGAEIEGDTTVPLTQPMLVVGAKI
jgi:hypothetical protein